MSPNRHPPLRSGFCLEAHPRASDTKRGFFDCPFCFTRVRNRVGKFSSSRDRVMQLRTPIMYLSIVLDKPPGEVTKPISFSKRDPKQEALSHPATSLDAGLAQKPKLVENQENLKDVKPQKYLCENRCGCCPRPHDRHSSGCETAYRRCFFKY